MKKILSLLLVLVLVLSLVACNQEPAKEADTDQGNGGTEEGGDSGDYKIGIVTGTVSQGEEEFRAGERMVEEYGDMIKHITYPDKFDQEVETTIAQVDSLASD